jgi:hypothetical protein
MKYTLMLAVLASTLAGCIVHSRDRGVRERRECPPAHHWENGYCVHNGHGHDHDHDHDHGRH